MNTFIGVDLGWYGKPTGLASFSLDGSDLHLRSVARLQGVDEILRRIHAEAGSGSAIAAVDAPLVIWNRTSIRQAERRERIGPPQPVPVVDEPAQPAGSSNSLPKRRVPAGSVGSPF